MEEQRENWSRLMKTFYQLRIPTISPLVLVGVAIVFLGTGTGFLLSQASPGANFAGGKIVVAPGAKVMGQEVGLSDRETFRDEAEGQLEKGGIDGEGTHHLVRDGGPSQNVYLTSSVIDLDDFAGRRVQVWGETHKGQKAGWLMDVGRVKVVE